MLHLDKRVRTILRICGVLLLLCLLFPPTYSDRYDFLLTTWRRIDYGKLLLQCAAIFLLGGLALLIMKR